MNGNWVWCLHFYKQFLSNSLPLLSFIDVFSIIFFCFVLGLTVSCKDKRCTRRMDGRTDERGWRWEKKNDMDCWTGVCQRGKWLCWSIRWDFFFYYLDIFGDAWYTYSQVLLVKGGSIALSLTDILLTALNKQHKKKWIFLCLCNETYVGFRSFES